MTRRGDTLIYWRSHQSAKPGICGREGCWKVGRARHVVRGEVRSINRDPRRSDLPPIRIGDGRVTHVVTVSHKPGANEALEALHAFYLRALSGDGWRDWQAMTYTADLTTATGQEVTATCMAIRDWIVNWIDNNKEAA